MLRARSFLKYWLPVFVWMYVLFSASGDQKSFQRSSRIVGPLVHWLFPDLPQETVDQIVFVARKGVHLTVYAIMALLVWRALRKPVRRDPRPWRWSEAGFALAVCALYATTDELHQAFVPNRMGSVWDVLLDTSGAAVGLVFLWAFGRWRKKW